VIFRTTTRINHSTAVMELGPLKKRVTGGHFKKDPLNYVCVPAVSRKLHVRLLENMARAEKLADASSYNFVEGDGCLGVICNGVSYAYANDAVKDLNLEAKIRILRIGFSHPMPGSLIKEFLKACEKVLVIEEGEPYMEEAVKALAQEEQLTLTIKGKDKALFSRLYEFDPAMVRRCMADFFNVPHTPADALDLSEAPEVPMRPPNLCAGCSHRAVYYAVKKATEGMDTVYPSDIGCYTLGFLPPLSMADYVVCMGASVGSACGFSKVTGQKVIAFIGDSTFFHSGIAGLTNAVFNNHDFTLVILDNRTTAMTGHQPNPGVDMKELNLDGYGQVDIEALGIKEAVDFKGVSVIIAKEKCVLYAKSLKQLTGKAFYISNKCKNHRDCLNDLGCPAFYLKGKRVMIDADLCTGCALCAQVCPEHAILLVKD